MFFRYLDQKAHICSRYKVACSICMGGEPIDPLPHWEQGKFDKVMSKHMWIKHQAQLSLVI